MTDDSADTDQRAARRPYVKPFVRNLDVEDTEGKATFVPVEAIHGQSFGPS
jgi:hypothetical protein